MRRPLTADEVYENYREAFRRGRILFADRCQSMVIEAVARERERAAKVAERHGYPSAGPAIAQEIRKGDPV